MKHIFSVGGTSVISLVSLLETCRGEYFNRLAMATYTNLALRYDGKEVVAKSTVWEERIWMWRGTPWGIKLRNRACCESAAEMWLRKAEKVPQRRMRRSRDTNKQYYVLQSSVFAVLLQSLISRQQIVPLHLIKKSVTVLGVGRSGYPLSPTP